MPISSPSRYLPTRQREATSRIMSTWCSILPDRQDSQGDVGPANHTAWHPGRHGRMSARHTSQARKQEQHDQGRFDRSGCQATHRPQWLATCRHVLVMAGRAPRHQIGLMWMDIRDRGRVAKSLLRIVLGLCSSVGHKLGASALQLQMCARRQCRHLRGQGDIATWKLATLTRRQLL